MTRYTQQLVTESTKWRPGQLARFRLGERVPMQMPCCGRTADGFEALKEFSGQVFPVATPRQFALCPFCHNRREPDPRLVPVQVTFLFNGVEFYYFGAYPQELELVEETQREET